MPTLAMICPRCWGAHCPACQQTGLVPDEQLSEHFALSELLHSSTAIRLGIPNLPDAQQLANLRRLATELLEPVRALIGPMHVDSGLRQPELNRAVGGSPTGAHPLGLAADCVPLQTTRKAAIEAVLQSGIPFDQVIHEGTWVHLAILSPRGEQRRQVLTAVFTSGHASYMAFDASDPRVQA